MKTKVNQKYFELNENQSISKFETQRGMYSINYLYQKRSKSQINDLSVHFKKLQKEKKLNLNRKKTNEIRNQ